MESCIERARGSAISVKYDIHKLIINPRSAITACRLKIFVYYPDNCDGLTEKNNTVALTLNNKKVTCPRCLIRMKND